jgi:putative membrane protein
MKNLLFFIYSVAFTVMIACSSQSKDSKELADSINSSKDTATSTSDIITVRENEAEFATNAADASLAEINFANLAISKTNNQEIKAYANMMLKDHGTANDELMTLAKSKNVTLPAAMSAEHQKRREELNSKSGADFDKAYAKMMEENHVKVLAFMEHQARKGTDPDLKAFAAKMVPVVNAHLNAIRKIKDGLK